MLVHRSWYTALALLTGLMTGLLIGHYGTVLLLKLDRATVPPEVAQDEKDFIEEVSRVSVEYAGRIEGLPVEEARPLVAERQARLREIYRRYNRPLPPWLTP